VCESHIGRKGVIGKRKTVTKMTVRLPKQQTGIKLTKAQKEEHRIWVNLNEFRKQFKTYTLRKDISDMLFNMSLYWADEEIVWDSDDEKKQAEILQEQGIKRLKEEGRQEARREREEEEARRLAR
jgi:hypothetical protein